MKAGIIVDVVNVALVSLGVLYIIENQNQLKKSICKIGQDIKEMCPKLDNNQSM